MAAASGPPMHRGPRRRRIGAAIAACSIVVALTATVAPAAEAATAQPTLASVRAQILKETNAARTKAKLPALKEVSGLDTIGQACSTTQARAAKMAHCLTTKAQYQRAYPTGWRGAGENVAFGYGATAVTTAWLNSPGHRANILNASFTHIGIGVAYDTAGRPYYTQNFGAYPNGLPATPAPTPKTLTAPTPKITGTAKVGRTLTAATGTWTPGTTLVYRWYADGAGIPNATNRTFVATAAQAGTRLTVKVNGKKSGYTSVTRTSAAVRVVR